MLENSSITADCYWKLCNVLVLIFKAERAVTARFQCLSSDGDKPRDSCFWQWWQKGSPRGQCEHRFQPSEARGLWPVAQVMAKATGDPGIRETKFTVWSCSLGGAEFSSLEGLRSRGKPGDTAKNWGMVSLKAPTTGLPVIGIIWHAP